MGEKRRFHGDSGMFLNPSEGGVGQGRGLRAESVKTGISRQGFTFDLTNRPIFRVRGVALAASASLGLVVIFRAGAAEFLTIFVLSDFCSRPGDRRLLRLKWPKKEVFYCAVDA